MKICFLITLLQLFFSISPMAQEPAYKKGRLLYKDNFSKGLANWIVEVPADTGYNVAAEIGRLLMDVRGGATVWFGKKLSGNLLIEFKRTVLMAGGKNDRLSDLNQFWMASDPRNKTLFTRNGVFELYDSLLLYYAGMGGNSNTTTRFRKYDGRGNRILLTDFSDSAHLLQPNKEYRIRIVVYNGLTQFFVDDVLFFSYNDGEPIREGHFGLRTTWSRQVVDDFKVYRLK